MEKSKVMKYFTKIKDAAFAQCLRWPKKISIKNSNTTGLLRHLEHIHKICLKRQIELDEESLSTPTGTERLPPGRKRSKSVQNTLQFEVQRNQSLEEIVSMLAAKDGLTIRQITRSDFIR